MSNDVEQRVEEAPRDTAPPPRLLILATDEDAVCVDDLCLPAGAREPGQPREAGEPRELLEARG